MKKKLCIFLLTSALFISCITLAKQATETISVIYDNIKIMIDGVEYTPTDASGATVEPFIYNGTTYLPVRAIANAFNKDVAWEPQTSTVTLGSKNYDWLDSIGYADYSASTKNNILFTIGESTEMVDSKKFDRGIGFLLHPTYLSSNETGSVELKDGTIVCNQKVSYLLNQQYKTFTGTICVERALDYEQPAIIKIYGDGNLIYTSPILSAGTKSTAFNLNIENYKLLTIDAGITNPTNDYGKRVRICIAEARLEKK